MAIKVRNYINCRTSNIRNNLGINHKIFILFYNPLTNIYNLFLFEKEFIIKLIKFLILSQIFSFKVQLCFLI